MDANLVNILTSNPDLKITVEVDSRDMMRFGLDMMEAGRIEGEKKAKTDEGFLTPEQVQELVQISPSTLRRWRVGKILCPVWIAGLRRYRKQDVLALVTEDSDTTITE